MQFYRSEMKIGEDLPTVVVKINGIHGNAYIDTGARTSIAGSSLYEKLRERNHQFNSVRTTLTLADGTTTERDILTTKANIQLREKLTKITLDVLPDAKDNRTLLGIDFLEEAGIIINTPQRAWCFIENMKVWNYYDLQHSRPNQITGVFPADTKAAQRAIDLPKNIQPTNVSKVQRALAAGKRKRQWYTNVTSQQNPEQDIGKKSPPSTFVMACERIFSSPKRTISFEETTPSPNVEEILNEMRIHKILSPLKKTPEKKTSRDTQKTSKMDIFMVNIDDTFSTDDRQSGDVTHLSQNESELLNKLLVKCDKTFQRNDQPALHVAHQIILAPTVQLNLNRKDCPNLVGHFFVKN